MTHETEVEGMEVVVVEEDSKTSTTTPDRPTSQSPSSSPPQPPLASSTTPSIIEQLFHAIHTNTLTITTLFRLQQLAFHRYSNIQEDIFTNDYHEMCSSIEQFVIDYFQVHQFNDSLLFVESLFSKTTSITQLSQKLDLFNNVYRQFIPKLFGLFDERVHMWNESYDMRLSINRRMPIHIMFQYYLNTRVLFPSTTIIERLNFLLVERVEELAKLRFALDCDRIHMTLLYEQILRVLEVYAKHDIEFDVLLRQYTFHDKSYYDQQFISLCNQPDIFIDSTGKPHIPLPSGINETSCLALFHRVYTCFEETTAQTFHQFIQQNKDTLQTSDLSQRISLLNYLYHLIETRNQFVLLPNGISEKSMYLIYRNMLSSFDGFECFLHNHFRSLLVFSDNLIGVAQQHTPDRYLSIHTIIDFLYENHQGTTTTATADNDKGAYQENSQKKTYSTIGTTCVSNTPYYSTHQAYRVYRTIYYQFLLEYFFGVKLVNDLITSQTFKKLEAFSDTPFNDQLSKLVLGKHALKPKPIKSEQLELLLTGLFAVCKTHSTNTEKANFFQKVYFVHVVSRFMRVFVLSLNEKHEESYIHEMMSCIDKLLSPGFYAKEGETLFEARLDAQIHLLMPIFAQQLAVTRLIQTHTTKRILLLSTSSDSITEANEEYFIQLLSHHQETLTLQHILKQIHTEVFHTSRDFMTKLYEHPTNPLKNVHVNIVSLSTWSCGSVESLANYVSDYRIPRKIYSDILAINTSYASTYTNKKLQWMHRLSKVELMGKFKKRIYKFTTSIHQAAILNLFTDQKTTIQVNDVMNQKIKTISSLNQHDEMIQAIQKLLKTKVLLHSDKNPSDSPDRPFVNGDEQTPISGTTYLQINERFAAQQPKINLNIKLEKQKNEERTQNANQINNDRRVRMEAALVRILKQHRTITHNQLMNEAIELVKGQFTPKPAFIKDRINDLMEREYLDRHPDLPDTYQYKA